ncbi:hypothetical protein HMPREF9719_01790 [Corynebacterium otitidis ATCC 51513]|uniref:Uncharacterized protein n=2 Tax=Corynebacterium otitidis TaxID=29321 RepID=I7L9Q2_9CORY|nr:hypothetical protein HMPREF9719_01790 [Corynebacterium otitidis ATCC 51513]CCI83962.1 hypothetical protein BN46_1237 [Corynebacterium otitidis ATCC 51513]
MAEDDTTPRDAAGEPGRSAEPAPPDRPADAERGAEADDERRAEEGLEQPTAAPDPDAEEPSDLVDQSFAAMRRAARRRGGRLPSLGPKPRSARRRLLPPAEGEDVRVPGLAADERPRRRYKRGVPTGRDGYKIRPRKNLDSLGSLVGREIRHRGWNRDVASAWVTGNWAEFIGEPVASHTTVEMLKGTTLFLSCDSTAWATNLRLIQTQILARIAEKVGRDVITELKIFGPRGPSWRKGRLHVKGRGPRDTYG